LIAKPNNDAVFTMRLRIESNGTAPTNDYRIVGEHVEFRVLDSSGPSPRRARSGWRVLDESDINLHHALGTVVSKWLQTRLQPGTAQR
jgi:hypothetical protein